MATDYKQFVVVFIKDKMSQRSITVSDLVSYMTTCL